MLHPIIKILLHLREGFKNKHFEGSCELLSKQFDMMSNSGIIKFIAASLETKSTENQFKVQLYRKPVQSSLVQNTNLKYTCTEYQFKVNFPENQFKVNLYRKPA